MNTEVLILPCLVGGTLVAATQILSVILSIMTGKRSLTRSAVVASIIPISPLALIGIPFAIWYWTRSSQSISSDPASDPTHKSSRGATTLIWLREKRVAKVFSVLDTLVGSLVILGISIFFFGLYPTRIDYRLLIASDLDKKAKVEMQQVSRDAIRARLAGLQTVTDSKADSMPSIQAWAFQRNDIVNRLQLTRSPKLHILVTSDWSASDSVGVHTLPIAEDLNDAKNAVELAPFGKVVRCIEVPEGLASDRVRSIASGHQKVTSPTTTVPDYLVIEWSQQGRKELKKILTNSKTNAKTMFGIEIDGTIVAVSELQCLDGSKTRFELSGTSRWNVNSIIAAVRGPDIPCELECLSR